MHKNAKKINKNTQETQQSLGYFYCMLLIHRGSVNYQYAIDILTDNINQKNRQMLKKRDVECKRWGSVVERNEKFMESLWQTDPPSRDEPQEYSAEKYGSDAKTIVASVFCLTDRHAFPLQH